ncbi:hypothetical protein MNBD_UNCLBAC01-966, partial [hydrothermal vent metagenome]
SYASSASANDWLLYNSSNLNIFRGGQSIVTGVALNDDLWHQVAVSWQGSDGALKVYKDGVLAFTGTLASGTSISEGGSLILGQEQDSVGGGFDSGQTYTGSMDEVRIYNQVLSDSDVSALYTADING